MFESALIKSAEGHVVIKDKVTSAILVDKKNAVHFGNLSQVIAQALAGDDTGHVRFLAFGNGGTTIDSSGQVVYKTPNTSLNADSNAALYNVTYFKDVSVNTAENSISAVTTTSNYADLVITATLSFGEPSGQDAVDNTTDNEGDFVFDELALYNGTTMGTLPFPAGFAPNGRLLTHIVFHPVQKSLNREIEIEYTLRVQMS